MSTISGFNPNSISSGNQGCDTQSIGGSSNLLTQLEDRVSQTLASIDDRSTGGAGLGLQAIDPQEVAAYMAEISSSPIAGTNLSSIV